MTDIIILGTLIIMFIAIQYNIIENRKEIKRVALLLISMRKMYKLDKETEKFNNVIKAIQAIFKHKKSKK